MFGLGGTIAMTPIGAGGVVPTLSTAQLITAVPGLNDVDADVEVCDFRQLPGASLGFTDIYALAAEIDQELARGAAGVVVVQGTDTIEETAYLLDLVHARPGPIVVTGAMRSPATAGADGPGNLLAAVQTAASPAARDLGAVVVLADEIHAAAQVRKTHSTSGATFRSPNGGPLGMVVEGSVVLLGRPGKRTVLPGSPLRPVSVAVVAMTFDDPGVLLRAVAGEVDGLVVAGFGAGHVPAHLVELLGSIAARIPVVLSSRTGAGPVLTSTYAFNGSESDLLAHGLIPAGLLDPFKARVLLHHLLASGRSATAVRATFLGEPTDAE